MTESVSLACQWGRCHDCPEWDQSPDDAECTCQCHTETGDTDD